MFTSAQWLRAICFWLPFVCGTWLLNPAAGSEADLEIGHPVLENFGARTYRADNQIWSATQDAAGIMYFGNKGLVLEYDGVTWQKIFVSNDKYVIRGLAADPVSGSVYVGGLNNLGSLKPAADGGKVFSSLLDRLPVGDRNFGSIYRVYATMDGIFFVAAKQVMRWRDGAFRLWKFPIEDRLQSGYSAGNLYVQSAGLGLQRLTENQFVSASDDPFFRSATLTGIAPGPAGSLVIGTQHDGLFTLRGGVLAPSSSDLNMFFKSKEVRGLLRLHDGSLAVATGAAGIIVLNADDRFRDRWDEASGLQSQITFDLFEDREEGVWLCLYVGISRVQTGSPLSVFDASNGLKPTSIHAAQRYQGTLYLGTDAGLYRLVPADPMRGFAARFERLPGMDADYWGLCATEHGLLISGLGTVYQFDRKDEVTPIGKFPYSGSTIWPGRGRPERVFLGTRSALSSFRFDEKSNRWLDEGPVAGVAAEVHSFAETSTGDFWLGSNDHGMLRLRFAPDDAAGQRGPATVTSFLGEPGPLSGMVGAGVSLSSNGGVIAFTGNGLSRFDDTTQKFQPTNEYGREFADGSFGVELYLPGKPQGAWLLGRSTNQLWPDQQGGWSKVGQQDGTGSSFQSFPHEVFDKLTAIQHLLPEDDGIVWIASPAGIVRLNAREWLRRQGRRPAGFSTLIRQATATARTSMAGAPAVFTLRAAGTRLDAAHNSVQFELAADTYVPGADVVYQTRLEGFGAGRWGPPDAHTRVEYTNLPEGNYVFEARAQNADGVLAQVARVSFAVTPPWQRTGWAYALYAVLAALAMVSLLRWRLGRLRTTNARLEALVAVRTGELRTQQLELMRARDAADATNRAKSAFLANMSHELRTPLNAVLGYSQILLDDPELSARNRERVNVVGQSGHHLLSMINEVLDISKIEAGKLTLDPVKFSLGALLEEVGAAFEPRFKEKGLSFWQESAARPRVIVQADAGKLRQVLFNLLSNAAKFTPRGEVRFVVGRNGAEVWRFEVSDTGVGIAESELKSIFVAFQQGNAGKKSAQGTGLGLAISQRLVELLGGQLQVESKTGQGSRFWFELRLPASSEMPVEPEQAFWAGRKISGFHGPSRRLLVADDEPVNRQILREMLAPLGFEMQEAADGAQTLEFCARQPPDALLLDLRMEPVDGFEVARRLRHRGGEGQIIKIIAISASVFESDRQHAIDAGCDDFLAKPFEKEKLLAMLHRLLMLEWVFAAAPEILLTSPPQAKDGARPPQAELDTMLEFSRCGDILGIKKRLSELVLTDHAHHFQVLIHRLEPLIAGYQMDRIREVLEMYKNGGHDD